MYLTRNPLVHALQPGRMVLASWQTEVSFSMASIGISGVRIASWVESRIPVTASRISLRSCDSAARTAISRDSRLRRSASRSSRAMRSALLIARLT